MFILRYRVGGRIRKTFRRKLVMQMAITFMAVVAGMVFSLAVALLAEEFIFGQVFRLFFARQSVQQTAPVRTELKH